MRNWFAAVLWPTILCFATPAAALDDFALTEAYLTSYKDRAAFDGVVLITDGDQIVWQQAFGFSDYSQSLPMTTDSRIRLASLSTQFTQAAIGQLIDDGKLGLQSRLADFLPDFPNARRITIKHLLDHAAGIAHTDQLSWMDMSVAMTLDDIVAGLATEDLDFPPGIDTKHSDGGYALLANIVQLASGVSYGEFIEKTFANSAYPSLGHEKSAEVVPGMTTRYAPGPVYGERVKAETYVSSNKIGAGSLYANAEDVFRFYRDSYAGRILSADTTTLLFDKPESGTVQFAVRAPGTRALISMDFAADVTVVVLSANSAGPAALSEDIVSLYRGEDIALRQFTLADAALPVDELQTYSGKFRAQQFDRIVTIESLRGNLVFIHGNIKTAFAKTTDGEFHLPFYDWLCRFSAYNTEFVCRSRDVNGGTRLLFERQ